MGGHLEFYIFYNQDNLDHKYVVCEDPYKMDQVLQVQVQGEGISMDLNELVLSYPTELKQININ